MEWSTPNPGSIASDHLPLSVIGFVPGCWTIMMAPIPLYFLRGLYLWASHIFTTPSALGKYSATSKPGKSMKVSPQWLAGHFRDQTKGVLLCYSMCYPHRKPFSPNYISFKSTPVRPASPIANNYLLNERWAPMELYGMRAPLWRKLSDNSIRSWLPNI